MAKADTTRLVREIEETRLHLADTVDALVDRAHPKSIARRGLASVKGRFVDEQGSVRLETVVPVVAGTAAVITAIVILRRLVR